VLAEPTSICARGVRHTLAIGARQPWQPKRALVIGAGAVGLLATMLLRLEGLEVCVASQEPSSPIAGALGAEYVSTASAGLAGLDPFDVVVEAAGDAQLMLGALGLLGRSGVACLLGIDTRSGEAAIANRVVGVDTVLENRVLFGSVNAHHRDWVAGVDALDRARRAFPGALEELVGLRVPLDRFEEAFRFRGGKATLLLEEGGS
jgi:threonine dehydrogenase-like Zn-dependent dehydrogenase